VPDPSLPLVTDVPATVDGPGPGASIHDPAPRGHRSGWFAPVRLVIVAVVVAALVVAWVLTRSSGPAYRTAQVETGSAVATLSTVGTITPV